jgi:transglutaminase-like putative cysteine protease
MSTIAVATLLSGTRWLLHALGAIVLVFVLALAGRAARLPGPVVIAAQLVACVGYLTAFYAGPVAILGFIPGPAATDRLRDRVHAAFDALNGVTPPFTPGHDVALLAVAGVAAAAIAVDALAAQYRRPLLAGVPLLMLYAVPASVLPEGPRTWFFALPALGLLLLFVGDDRERLVRWGLVGDRALMVRSSARKTGVKIGLCVLAISLIVPALVTAGSAKLLDDKGFGRQKDDPITTLDPLVDMRQNLVRFVDTDLLEVTSDTTKPQEQYLRAVTLDEFNGSQWKASDRTITKFDTALPPPQGLEPTVTTTPVQSSIRGLPTFQADYLPMPYPSTRLQIKGKWRLDPLTGNVVSTGGRKQAAGIDYAVSGLDLYPRREDVGVVTNNDQNLQRYVELPTIPKEIRDAANSVTRKAMGPLEIGIKLQSWFRNPRNFTYDLSTPQGSGSNAILDFLKYRRGYCEQFAATMAVMARSLGVPARVNVGFTSGEAKDAAAGGGTGADGAPIAAIAGGSTRTISAYDAHAWPELLLPGVGWTRFEPTPGKASSGPTVPQWLQEPEKDAAAGKKDAEQAKGKDAKDAKDAKDKETDKGKSEDASSPPPPPSGSNESDASDCTNRPDSDACQMSETKNPVQYTESGHADHTVLIWTGIILFLLLLLAATPALLRLAIRRRRWASITGRKHRALVGSAAGAALLAEVAWLELRDSAIDLGYAWPRARTPRQAAVVLVREGHLRGRSVDALIAITALIEQAPYSAGGGSGGDRAFVRGAVDQVVKGLSDSLGRDARFFAIVAPRSLRTSLGRPDREKRRGRVRGALRRVTRRPA